jgi:hypothetical protein
MRMLRKSFEKDWNYINKKLADVNKLPTFAPATAIDVHRNTDKQNNQNWKFIFKKDLKKLVRFEKGYYICTPQNTESSLKDW